jgi:hypothetical protein
LTFDITKFNFLPLIILKVVATFNQTFINNIPFVLYSRSFKFKSHLFA